MVTLETDRIGSQLQQSSRRQDPRGASSARCASIATTGDGARLALALKPEQVGQIPADVTARLLPKTLFGEKYVDLVAPGGRRRRADPRRRDVIRQDRTTVAIELEKVLDDLLPLLRTVQPAKLNGHAQRPGHRPRGPRRPARREPRARRPVPHASSTRTCPPSRRTSPAWPTWPSTYAVAAPDLVRAATALITTNSTIVEKQDAAEGALRGVRRVSPTPTADFLAGQRRPDHPGGPRQPPQPRGLREVRARVPLPGHGAGQLRCRSIDGACKDDTFHITLEITSQRDGYQPGEEPACGEKRGPDCCGLPDPLGSQANPRVPGRPSTTAPTGGGNGASSALPSAFLGRSGAGIADVDSGLAGTEEEQQVVAALLAADRRRAVCHHDPAARGRCCGGAVVSQR